MAILKNNLIDNFTKIPNDIILSDLSNESFRLLIYLYSKPNDWKIYQDNIAKDFGVTRQTVNKRFKELKDKKFVAIDKIVTRSGSFDYEYTLLNSTVSTLTDTVQTLQGVSTLTDTVDDGHGSDVTHTKTNLTKTDITKTYFTNNDVNDIFVEYLEMRKRIRKPLKDCTRLVNTLNKYTDGLIISALDQSITHEYIGVFPDKFAKQNGKTDVDWSGLIDNR